MRLSHFVRRIIFIFLILFAPVRGANAATFYLEVGPGLSMINNASTVFRGAFTTGALAFSANTIFAFQTGGPLSPMNFHLGARGQLLSGLNGALYGNLYALYPMVRLEFYRFYIGAGITPLAMTRVSPAPGIDSLIPVNGVLPFFLEGGLEWKMIPDFHLNLGATAHGALAGGAFAMFPSYEFSLQFRFLFSIGGKSAASASSNSSGPSSKWDGWRYPFGIGK